METANIFKYFKILIFVISISYFIYFAFNNYSQFFVLEKIGIINILLIFILKILNIIFLSNINIHLLRNLDIKLNNIDSLDLTIKNTLGNLTSPFRLGSGYKITYLKSNFDLRIKDYIYWSSWVSIINLYPLFLIFIIFYINEQKPLSITVLQLITFTLLSIFFIVPITKIFRNRLNIESDFHLLSRNNLMIQINNILFFLSTCLVIFTVINSVSDELSFYSAVAYNFLGSFINLVNITPGNIGVKEGLIILFNDLHLISNELIIITSFVERLASIITLFGYQLILKKKKKHLN
jgi:hypothetical protein